MEIEWSKVCLRYVFIRIEYVKDGDVVCCAYNYKHRLGETWSVNFIGKNEYPLLLHDTKGLES